MKKGRLIILKSRWKWVFILLFFGVLPVVLTPRPEFNDPTSTVVLSAENDLLGARIARDGQWRFPKTDSIPYNYEISLLTYEDRYFYRHPGINPVSLVRAAILNIKHRRIVSGGSTISMQVSRLARKNPPRTFSGKFLEMIMALKLEMLLSKKEILAVYASNAPFGGNVVGIDAAAWRYFQRPAHELSWAEASTLAVLPNAPSLIYPGRNSNRLKDKRDQLLFQLFSNGVIDSLTYQVSIKEPVPKRPEALPNFAPHAIEEMALYHEGKKVHSTLKINWQKQANEVARRNARILAENDIHNLAILILDVETGKKLSYVGNVPGLDEKYDSYVNLVKAPRSTGSILKPFLYASMLEYGMMMPDALIKDTPINFAGYAPKNFDYQYTGALPASQALSQSRNIPAVEMLHQFGEARFLEVLRDLQLTTFQKPAEHYGLSLILGGGEANLYELARAYANMAKKLKQYQQMSSDQSSEEDTRFPFHAGPIYTTFDALLKVNRPEGRMGWWNFNSTEKVAWKTGTSFGFRDAWAIGTTPNYVVAVWCGNANGEGRAGLTGSKAAAPVLFDVLDFLPPSGWFAPPEEELTVVNSCKESGYKASPLCPNVVQQIIPVSCQQTTACPYHHIVHLSNDRLWQVNTSCYPLKQMIHDSLFVLPPAMEWYYRNFHPEYFSLPPLYPGCVSGEGIQSIEIISPRNFSRLYVPLEMNGKRGKIIFEAAHRNMNTSLFWHLDGTFIGTTDHFHQMALSPTEGKHQLSIMDKEGNLLETNFTILAKKD